MQRLSNNNKGEITIVYLSGNPGSGKSEMARQIGEKFYNDDDYKETIRFVTTLDSSSLNKLLTSYVTLAGNLSCYPDSITAITTSKELCTEDKILQLKALVNKQVLKYSAWLIIVDNVTDLKSFSKYWPQMGEKTDVKCKGQVLVTTQDSSSIGVSSHGHHASISGGMSQDDAIKLLCTVSNYRDTDNDIMLKVANALDLQPLALSSVAVYVQGIRTISKQYSWHQCLMDFEKERKTLESVYENTSLAYKLTMTVAVNLALQREMSNEIIMHAFCFLSVIASDPIPLECVVEYVVRCLPNENRKNAALRVALSSLILSTTKGTDKNFICIHQVVYHCLQSNQEVSENRFSMFNVICAFSLLPTQMDEENIDKFLDQLKTLRPLVNHLAKIATKLTDCVMEDFKRVVAAHSENNQLISDTLHNLGKICRRQFLLQESITYLEKALAIQTATLGENHPSVGNTLNDLGLAHLDLGRLQKSITYLEKVLAIRIATLGENHQSVRNTLNKLELAHLNLRRLQESITYLEKALAIKTATLGEKHPSVGDTLNNLGLAHLDLRRLQESITSLEKALAIKTATLGENLQSVGDTLNNLGRAHLYLRRL